MTFYLFSILLPIKTAQFGKQLRFLSPKVQIISDCLNCKNQDHLHFSTCTNKAISRSFDMRVCVIYLRNRDSNILSVLPLLS